MIISRDTFRKHPTCRLLATVLPVITFCMLVAPVIPLKSYGCIPMAFAQEPVSQAYTNRPNQTRLTPKQQQEIIDKNVRIRKLQEGIIDHKIKILDTKIQEKSLLGDLERIEKELQSQKQLLASLSSESEKQELLLTDKQQYLNQVLTEKKAHQVHVKNRLAAYYRMGSVGLMNVLFSSESLPDILDFKEYFGIMVQHDHAIIQKYLAQILESNRAREEHAREQLRLMKLTEELGEKEKQLGRISQEKNLLLKKVNTEQHLYEQAVQEIEDAASDLAATLQKIQSAAKQQPAAPQPQPEVTLQAGIIETEKKKLPKIPAQEGFPGQKGLLEPPVNGTVITHFDQNKKGKFESSTTSDGIDIRVKKGQEITAVYDGKIIHSGYLRGYGNLMIIDHGQQYFSLISRAADFYAQEGTKIAKGEIIGMTGDGDPLYGEGLHFEIRKGAKPEDPLLWLRENSLPNAAPPPNK